MDIEHKSESYFAKRIVLFCSAIILFTICIVSYVFYQSSLEVLAAKEQLIVENDQELLENSFTSSVLSMKEDIKLLSQVPPIQGIIRAKANNGFDKEGNSSLKVWKERLDIIFDRFLESHTEYLTARYIGIADDGKELVKVKRHQNNIVNYSDEMMQTKSHRDYFFHTISLQEGQIYFSEINLNREHEEIEKENIPVLRISIPIYDSKGNVFGLVILNKKMEETSKRLKDIVKQPQKLYLVNSRGDILIHPDGKNEFSFEFGKPYSIHNEIDFIDLSTLKSSTFPKVWDKINKPLVSLNKVSFQSGNQTRNLYSIIVTDKKINSAEIYSTAKKIIITGLILLIICVALAWSLANSVVMPLNNIVKVMRKYANERILEPLPKNQKGEIGELANTFEFVVGEVDKQNDLMTLAHAQLEEQQMRTERARFEAEEANKFKSEFLANMSHEIRTPLNAIIGYSDLMMDEELSVEQKNMMKTVSQSSNTLLELINDVLDLSKIEAGEMSLEEVEFDLEDLAYQVSDQSKGKIKNKDLQLHVISDNLNNNLLGDPTRLKQVLINLVGNAVKFTEHGEIITKLKIVEDKSSELKVNIEVSDTGIGIAEDNLKNIFEAFKQADGSTTRNYGGTGLGLNISRKLVNLMGGELKVTSKLGRGTTFYFSLKLKKGKPWEGGIELVKKDLKILLIEKNKTSQKIIKKYCETSGAELFTENNIDDALSLIELKKDIDLILTDLDIEECSEFRSKLPEIYQSEIIPLMIAMATDISPTKLQAVKQLQYDTYVYKPLRYQTFCETINKLFTVKDKKSETHSGISGDMQPAEILLVEDNKINQRLALKVLEKMGHTVTLAENGKEALEIVENKNFDLIFMDVQMPVMDGIEATKELRKRGCTIPVIALTANAFDSDKVACLSAGMNDFASKPLERNVIKNLIIRYTEDDIKILDEEEKDSA